MSVSSAIMYLFAIPVKEFSSGVNIVGILTIYFYLNPMFVFFGVQVILNTVDDIQVSLRCKFNIESRQGECNNEWKFIEQVHHNDSCNAVGNCTVIYSKSR